MTAVAAPPEPRPIADVAASMGVPPELLEPYGRDIAKIDLRAVMAMSVRPRARYILVSGITPTPLGEGKTVTAIGLGQGFAAIGRSAVVALRQGSMGPTFGVKGAAAGGGRARLVPFDRVALHLTGDMHAVAAAHNLLAAMVDNHLFHGNPLGIDPQTVTWRRTIDVDDRSLRQVVVGLGSAQDGIPRQSGFDMTAASEVMAILALSTSLLDLRDRLGRIVVASTREGEPVTAEQLHAAGAMAVILREALQPNLLQTAEGTPVLVHAGPFGNIAHGNSSIVADLVGLHGGDFLVTEAGFGADMGAERFFDIKCRTSGLRPDAAVVVATVRALKAHSGRHRVVSGRGLPDAMLVESPDEVHQGAVNLRRQVENIRVFGVTPVVALNAFPTDHRSEWAAVREVCDELGVRMAVCNAFADGGRGAAELAEVVAEAAEEPSALRLLYPDSAGLREKVEAVATRIYGAAGVEYTAQAGRDLDRCERLGLARGSVCIAKTPLSLTADPSRPGAPTGWTLPVREARANAGAGFVTVLTGDVRLMPGLPTHPAAERIDIDEGGDIVGLT